jgi:beta-glucanase (GH16 family)
MNALLRVALTGLAALSACSLPNGTALGVSPDPNDPWSARTLVWSDEFSGAAVDTSRWTYDLGAGGWGNAELETYTTANASVQTVGGASCLVITAQKDGAGNWTSARLKTQGLQTFSSGKIEARVKLPRGQGMWPAFWMLGSNIGSVGWPACGETDILEMIGGSTGTRSDSKVYGTLHWKDAGSGAHDSYQPEQYTLGTGAFADGFHVFGIDWTATRITYFIDGVPTGFTGITDQSMGSTFQKPFFLILNLAVGGNWPGSPDSTTPSVQTMAVDWVRVYQ